MTDIQDRTEAMTRADEAASAKKFADALSILEDLRSAGHDNAEAAIKRSSLHRALGNLDQALAAIDQALALEPLNFIALLFRGILLEKLGKAEAGEAYGRALAQLGDQPEPPALSSAVRHAREVYALHVADCSTVLMEGFSAKATLRNDRENRRLERFAGNVARKTRHYHSEPTDFHFPGLPEEEFVDRAKFDFLDRLEGATSAIRHECQALIEARHGHLVPYVQYGDDVPVRQWKALNHSLDWTAIHLLQRGARVDANARHCPATMAMLQTLPQPDLPGYAPNAMFSLLAPRTHIPPHHGVANFRLVCHLPLVVPDHCWFRVGAERRQWVEGEAFIFDDTIEHEAANESDLLRIVLIVDVWNPYLSEAERSGIEDILRVSTIDASGAL